MKEANLDVQPQEMQRMKKKREKRITLYNLTQQKLLTASIWHEDKIFQFAKKLIL